ncbi:hypothetical protein PAMP_003357 [Pampus punctatissimus]
MSQAVLMDLIHGWCPTCSDASLLEEPAAEPHVFLLCHKNVVADTFVRTCTQVQVLDSGSTAECLYRFKKAVDGLDLNSFTVLTSPQGRRVLCLYQELLFTAVYTFDYKVRSVDRTCPSCRGSAHTDTPGERVQEEVSAFLQQLPTLQGDVTALTSSLIPDCFGHGFSTRTGGVSYIPTLSSLNLFSSSRRRDPGAVVLENRRRLALHAGFYPLPLCLVKVNHASDVWIMGKAEPESYDAIVTNQSGVVVAAPGADCIPVLFADPVSMVIGAAHAGWKGTLMGVAMATVKAMNSPPRRWDPA